MDLELAGKVFLITGASRGIGAQIAADAAAEGARVAICGRDETALSAVADRLRAAGAEVLAVRTDLTDPAAPAQLVARTVETWGRLDVLVNNASADVSNLSARLDQGGDEKHLLSRIEGKLVPAIRCSLAAAPRMSAAGGGRIVMIGGVSARVVLRGPGGYGSVVAGMGNSALTNYAKHLSAELAPSGVLVNVVHPGVVATDRHPGRVRTRAATLGVSEAEAAKSFDAEVPIGRTIVPRDVSGVVLFLASPWASGITGQAIAVDGGLLDQVSY